MTIKLLVLCPHNAAKSVAGAAFLARSAEIRGIDIAVETAGTDPDVEVLPIVRQRLEADGHIIEAAPRLVTSQMLDSADVVINIGCSVADLPTTRDVRDWDVPNFSDDPTAAFSALEQAAVAMMSELAYRRSRPQSAP